MPTMDWIFVIDFAVGLAQIASCALLVYGAALAVIAALPAERNGSRRGAPHRPIRTTGEFGHSK